MTGRRRFAIALAIGWGGLLSAFLAHVAGSPLPAPLAFMVTAVVLLASTGRLLGLAWSTWRHAPTATPLSGPAAQQDPKLPRLADDRWAGRMLVMLIAVGLVVRFAGLDHEIAERSYLDEGTYYKYATAILAGDALPTSFVYPHFYFYLHAFALWLLAALDPVAPMLLRAMSRATVPLEVEWLVLRAVSAGLCTAVIVPVFLAARRLGGLLSSFGAGLFSPALASGTMAGLLVIFSPLFNSGAHLDICDAPSGAFAAVVVWLCGCLLALPSGHHGAIPGGLSRRQLYLLAGVSAAFAAGTKYPAGVVAVAIVAVALRDLWLSRRLSLDLVYAGAASLATFVITQPALVVHFEWVFGGGRDILFGVRQYAGGGWIGVQPKSNLLYYANNLLDSFGAPVLVLAALGLLAAPRALRAQLGWLAVFPVVYLLLIVDMTMVVRRNLFPVLPSLAILFAPLAVCGVVALVRWLAGVADRRRRSPTPSIGSSPMALPDAQGATVWQGLTGLLCLLAVAVPVWATSLQTVGYASATTRELASRWMLDHLPPGAGLVKESYTPDFAPSAFVVRQTRFAARLSPEELRVPEHDYLLLASSAFQRFLDSASTVKAHQELYGERYRELRTNLAKVAEWEPSATRLGPTLELYRITPLEVVQPKMSRRWQASEAFVPDAAQQRNGAVALAAAGHWLMVKETLAAGRWRCTSEPPAPHLELAVRKDSHELARLPVGQPFELAEPGPVFLYLAAPPNATPTLLSAFACGLSAPEDPPERPPATAPP